MPADAPQGNPASQAGQSLHGRRVLLGVTGSIAAYKAAELVRGLKKAGAEVQVLMTRDAARFISPLTLGTLSEREVLTDLFPENEDGSWTKHVQLGLWADLFVVAPATATTLAKLAWGICDSMLTATALSRRCPLVVCPAMDHDMFANPATQRSLRLLEEDGVEVMPPEYGELASGLVGDGRLPEPAAILEFVIDRLSEEGSLSGQRVLVTAGPTREAIDPVRFLSNGSTGTMGFALAESAARMGGAVTLVAGPSSLATPNGVRRVDVVSAQDMYDAAMEHSDADLVICAAAVSDYTPAAPSADKLKKADGTLNLKLERTPDTLAAIGAQKRMGQTVVGFALETNDGLTNARKKLQSKGADWIVLNHANEAGSGFGPGTNRVTLIGRNEKAIELPRLPKSELAGQILLAIALGPGADQ